MVCTSFRPNKRKRLASEGDGADPAEPNATDGPPHPMTHGELLKQKKKNMAFPVRVYDLYVLPRARSCSTAEVSRATDFPRKSYVSIFA